MIIKGKTIIGIDTKTLHYICVAMQGGKVVKSQVYRHCDEANRYAAQLWDWLSDYEKHDTIVKVLRVSALDLKDDAFADWFDESKKPSERQIDWTKYRYADTTQRCFDSTRWVR